MTAPASLLFSPARALPGGATGDAMGGAMSGFDALLAQLAATVGTGSTGETAAGATAATNAGATSDATSDDTNKATTDGSAAPAAFNGWFGLQPPTASWIRPSVTADGAATGGSRSAGPSAVDQPLVLPQPALTGGEKTIDADAITPTEVVASLPTRPAAEQSPQIMPLAPKPPVSETPVSPAAAAAGVPTTEADPAAPVPAPPQVPVADAPEASAPVVAAAAPPPQTEARPGAAPSPQAEARPGRKTSTGDSPVKVVAEAIASGDIGAGSASAPVAAADQTDPDPLPSSFDALADASTGDAAGDHPVDGFAQTLAGRLAGLASGANAAAAHLRSGPETINRLVAGIVSKIDGGQATRFDLQLDPFGLGKVDVRVEIGSDGRMVAALNFDNAQAASDLRSRGQELRQALEQAGFSIGDSGLSFDFAGQNSQRDPAGEDAPRSAFAGRAFAQALDALQDEAVVPRRFQAQRGLDILI